MDMMAIRRRVLLSYKKKLLPDGYTQLKKNKGVFIPCIRDVDGVVGVYNTITNNFLTNNGTGTFGYETLDGTYVAPIVS